MTGYNLNYSEAVKSPCETCKSSPCCSLFQLDSITTDNLMGLDTIRYYLNFNDIEVCLSPEGVWTVYYNYPCRFFVKEKSICTLHGTPQKPGVCVAYNPYYCFYKKAEDSKKDSKQGLLWINGERMEYLMTRVSFDDDRKLADIPDKDQLYLELSGIPYREPTPVDAPTEDKAADEWKQSVEAGTGPPDETVVKTHLDFQSPCSDCDSYCCKNLLFPMQVPLTYSSLDYVRYALGFPGIRLGISPDVWYVIVKTTCRHLDGTQCSIYENPGRPLICKYDDPLNCFHRHIFSLPKPNGFIRIGFEEFSWIMETFIFDDLGNIVEGRDVESLRTHVESKWLDTAGDSRI